MDQPTDASLQTGATGLAMIQAVFASGGFKRGLGATLGTTGREASEGRVVLVGSPTQDHYNPLGTVHGGYAATMLDAAIALALQTLLPTGTAYATTDLNITYLRPLTSAMRRSLRCLRLGTGSATSPRAIWWWCLGMSHAACASSAAAICRHIA